ncbi:MAG: hypothetical protein RR835_07240 [Peptostreptococcaceae bacterium]
MFDCKFISEYIGNLEYVSTGLLSIINTNILANANTAYTEIKDDKGVCIPFSDDAYAALFDCSSWQIIRNLLLVNSGGSNPGLIQILCDTLDCISKKVTGLGHGLASQFERFACLCKSLRDRLDCIVCNETCPEILGDFLCLLLQILTKLISAVSKSATLVYYADCDRTSANANSIVVAFFDCMACDFVNDLCELERLVNELNAIVIGFATCNLQQCTPCYVAPCAPKKVRPVCPPNMMNDGYGNRPRPGGGCGCNCNKGCK